MMPRRPGTRRRREAAPMPQQEFGEAMPRPQQIDADVLATAQQVADRFLLIRGDVNGGQRARPIQDRELTGITPVGLNPVAWSARNQRRSNDLARHPLSGQRPLQLEATRAGLIAAPDGAVGT